MANDSRVSLRISHSLVMAIDLVATNEDRSRTNWIVRILETVAPLSFKAIKSLQRPVPDTREKMLSFRLTTKAVAKYKKVAKQEERTKSDVYSRILMTATRPGWQNALAGAQAMTRLEEAEAKTARGEAATPVEDSVFA